MKIAGAIWMLVFLLWLPIEDTQIWPSAVLSFAACGWLGFRWLANRLQKFSWPQLLTSGALFGIVAPLLTITLMAFKSGLHAHGFADFTIRQLWLVFTFIPFTTAIGLIVAALLGVQRGRSVKHNL